MNLKNLVNILVELWPHMTDAEKDELCTSLESGDKIAIVATFFKIMNSVTTRVGGNK